jgi:hypothetical protein
MAIEITSDHDATNLATFVGKNNDYYQEKWQKMADNQNNPASWNVAALFLGFVWLIYRKMYRYAAIFIALVALDSWIEWYYPLPNYMSNTVNILIALGFGVYGNFLYKQHVTNKIKLISANTPPQQLNKALAMAGGVNLIGAWVVGLLLLAMVAYIIYYIIIVFL